MSYKRVSNNGNRNGKCIFTLTDSNFTEDVETTDMVTWTELYGTLLKIYIRRQIPLAAPAAAMMRQYHANHYHNVNDAVDSFQREVNIRHPNVLTDDICICVKRILRETIQ